MDTEMDLLETANEHLGITDDGLLKWVEWNVGFRLQWVYNPTDKQKKEVMDFLWDHYGDEFKEEMRSK